MMFLMNDVVLELGDAPPPPVHRLRALTLGHVLKLGAEMYSAEPLLHRDDPARARRLALLIASKSPEVNAALFSAPARGCPVEAVGARLATVAFEILAVLKARADEGSMTPAFADREVWRRMAA